MSERERKVVKPKSARAATMDFARARPTLRLVLGSLRGGEGTFGPFEPNKSQSKKSQIIIVQNNREGTHTQLNTTYS